MMGRGLPSYRKYKYGHALCNQHHHRELIAVVENDQQTWGQLMIDLLYDIKKKKEERIRAGFAQMEPEQNHTVLESQCLKKRATSQRLSAVFSIETNYRLDVLRHVKRDIYNTQSFIFF